MQDIPDTTNGTAIGLPRNGQGWFRGSIDRQLWQFHGVFGSWIIAWPATTVHLGSPKKPREGYDARPRPLVTGHQSPGFSRVDHIVLAKYVHLPKLFLGRIGGHPHVNLYKSLVEEG